MTNDTIAAIATAPGQGGVSIVRVSGPDAEKVLLQVFKPAKAAPLASHMLTYGHVYDADTTVDECMAVLMRAPRSYTREDVAEIQLHGGIAIIHVAISEHVAHQCDFLSRAEHLHEDALCLGAGEAHDGHAALSGRGGNGRNR